MPEEGARTQLNVFISYSRKDQAFAEGLARNLGEAGFNAYIDTQDIVAGEPWRERLAALIEGADQIVFLISPDSIASEICDWELEHAERLGKRILPVICRATQSSAIPVRLQRLQFTFLHPGADTATELRKLIAALAEDTAWVRRHTALVARAQHWHAAGRGAHAILRGQDLLDAEDLVLKRPTKHTAPEIPPVLQEFIVASRTTEREERDKLRRTLGLAYAEPVKTAYRAGEHEKAIKLAAFGALQADDLTFSLVPELWDAVAPSIIANPVRARLHRHAQDITLTALSVDRQLLVTASKDCSVRAFYLSARRGDFRSTQHKSIVTAVAIRHDAELVASASAAGDLIIWRPADGTVLRAFDGVGGVVTEISWSRDGALLALGITSEDPHIDGNHDILSLGSGNAIVRLVDGHTFATTAVSGEFPAPISALSFDGSSQRLAVGLFASLRTIDCAAYVLSTRSLKRTSLRFETHGQKIKHLFFSPRARFVVSNSEQELYAETEDQQVRHIRPRRDAERLNARDETRNLMMAERSWVQAWDATSGRKQAEFIGHTRVVNDVCVSPDGKRVLTAACDGSARVWDLATGIQLQRFFRREQDVYRASFSEDGTRVVTKAEDDSVRIWDVGTGNLLREFSGKRDDLWRGPLERIPRAEALSFTDGDRSICGIVSAGTPILWDAATSQLVRQFWPHKGPARHVRFTPDGKHIVSIGGERELVCIDATSGVIISRFRLRHPSLTYRDDNLTFFDDGRFVVVVTDDFRSYSHDVAVQCVDLTSGTTVFEADLKEGRDDQIKISLYPPGIAAPIDGNPTIWAPRDDGRDALEAHLRNNGAAGTIGAHPLDHKPTKVAGGRITISITREGDFAIQETATGKQLGLVPSKFGVVDGVRQAHGSRIAEQHATGVVRLFEYDAHRIVARSLNFNTGTVDEVITPRPLGGYGDDLNWDLDASGRFARCRLREGRSGSSAVGVFDSRTGALLAEFPHSDLVLDTDFHPNALQVTTACQDGGIRIWDCSRASIALPPQNRALLFAASQGRGWVYPADRQDLLLREAPEDLFDALRQAVPVHAADLPTHEPPVYLDPACYLSLESPEAPTPQGWSPFIESRRQKAIADAWPEAEEAASLRHTYTYRLADSLTKAALTVQIASDLAGKADSSDTHDEERLGRIDTAIHQSLELAMELQGCISYREQTLGTDASRDPDVLAKEVDLSIRGLLKDSERKQFDRAGIENVARRYLSASYRSQEFDVALVRALLGVEVYGLAHAIQIEKRMESKAQYVVIAIGVALLMLVLVGALGLGIRHLILAAHSAEIIGDWSIHLADVLAGAFAVICIQLIAGIPTSIARKYFGKSKGSEILRRMYYAYYEVPEYGPMAVGRLRKLVDDAASLGAVWPGSLYALLDDVDRRLTANT